MNMGEVSLLNLLQSVADELQGAGHLVIAEVERLLKPGVLANLYNDQRKLKEVTEKCQHLTQELIDQREAMERRYMKREEEIVAKQKIDAQLICKQLARNDALSQMRVFQENGKVNFVDTNNVFVGYDMECLCHEQADWFIANVPAEDVPENLNQPTELMGYTFDWAFFQEVNPNGACHTTLDEGGMVIFRLTSRYINDPNKYLHLFNCRNGYYCHGFEFKIGEEIKREGSL